MEIRKAGPLDISALVHLLVDMHNNAEVPLSPIHSEKLIAKVNQVIHKGVVFVAMKENVLLGSIGGMVVSDWWAENNYLSDLWLYVSPDHRKSSAGVMLIKNFKKVGNDSKIPVRLGHVFSGDIDRKDKWFNSLGFKKVGSVFVEV
jgi:N-acetylglutamate synthase-like GNAT family acetyltransferase|tara:strand:+ start:205 stop:642 length:438 start_codon:yes stop_codon:yes gene_type:complete